MKTIRLTLPEFGMAVGTRAMLGAGIALLISHKLDEKQQRTIGATLACVGALTTIPLAFQIRGHLEDGEK